MSIDLGFYLQFYRKSLYHVSAVCIGGCGDGTCMRPNLCLCPDGQVGPTCLNDGMLVCLFLILTFEFCVEKSCL